jgi:hypothetical protein
MSSCAGAPSTPVFDSSYERRLERAWCPGVLARLAARLRRSALDEELIRGADPAETRQLAARAAQLTSRKMRIRIANGLDRLVRVADEPPRQRIVQPRRAAVAASAGELRELSGLLRADAPVYVQGVAMVHKLLIDGTGPTYAARPEASLVDELRSARAAIAGCL